MLSLTLTKVLAPQSYLSTYPSCFLKLSLLCPVSCTLLQSKCIYFMKLNSVTFCLICTFLCPCSCLKIVLHLDTATDSWHYLNRWKTKESQSAWMGPLRQVSTGGAALRTLGKAPWKLLESAPHVHNILLSAFVTLRLHLGLIDLWAECCRRVTCVQFVT